MKMETVTLVVGIIGSIAAVTAAIFSWFAWRKPVPDLEFSRGKAQFIQAHDGRYILQIEVDVRNTGAVSAYIEDIKINGISPPEPEVVSIDERDVKQVKLNAFLESPGDRDVLLSPKRTLDRDKTLTLRVKTAMSAKPKKAQIRINTPKRPFRHKIADLREESDPVAWH